MKIRIEFSEHLIREYELVGELASKIDLGESLVIKTQHPDFSETFIASTEEVEI